MPDEIRRMDYYYVTVADKPGEGERVLAALRGVGINLLGVSAFPHGARKSQLDLIPEDSAAFAKAAKSAGLKLSKKKSGFVIQGEDRPGAVADIASKLAQANINYNFDASFLRRCRSLRRYAVGQRARSTQGGQDTRRRVASGVPRHDCCLRQ